MEYFTVSADTYGTDDGVSGMWELEPGTDVGARMNVYSGNCPNDEVKAVYNGDKGTETNAMADVVVQSVRGGGPQAW
ncbi:MAG: hypothetical protein L0K86_00220 [Actinomycetia bacterium]|nr:hypothetical protein [Actinomycetes bacterium]